jgi:alkylated DNA repair dioxygenase AlkB
MMKHKTDTNADTEKWTLESGDMIVMRGTTQSQWLHSVPKRTNVGGEFLVNSTEFWFELLDLRS